ncbi:hypothetical protein [Caballeronia choica]|uniref:hypothetical protein n=1 Tax=Caballeronia choica TaxID=326476 RepID=UPI00135772AB
MKTISIFRMAPSEPAGVDLRQVADLGAKYPEVSYPLLRRGTIEDLTIARRWMMIKLVPGRARASWAHC